MPFTFSHPAIVLPLIGINKRRKIFSSTGLIIGSIIPDFESFIRFDQHKAYSHTWSGMFWFDLPLAIIYAFVFHNIVRDPLIRNLPEGIGERFYSCTDFNWNEFFRKNFGMVIYSMLVGIASHLLWDAFTHLNLADPNATNSTIYVGRIRLYILLQYASSAIGLIAVVWYIVRLKGQGNIGRKEASVVTQKSKAQYWWLAAIIACVTVTSAGFIIDEPINIILLIEISISGILLALILAPVIQRILFANRTINLE